MRAKGDDPLIKPNVKVESKKNPAFEKFLADMKRQKGPHITVGVHAGAGTYENGQDVATVAAINEFGTEWIPPRPFLRNILRTKEEQINRLREKLVKQMVNGTLSMDKALDMLGFQMQQWVVNQITGRSPFEPNAPATIAAKERAQVTPPNKPLYWTGLLQRSIMYKKVL